MCGIVGILNRSAPIDQAELLRFTDTLTHRGPDGRGALVDANLGLGHRRLAILDLSADGRNPMAYGGADGQRYWITYNGEVYNFLELRAELEGLGHVFRTGTDTEVVVAAYVQWGEDCLLRFNGMWAFAIWDHQERSLFLARDRFGIKPLYYWNGSTRFAFASEMKAFLALDGFEARLDEEAARQSLANAQAYEGTRTAAILRGIERLPGGCSLRVRAGENPVLRRWWTTRDHLIAVPTRYEEQVEMFRDLFLDAVRLRLRSDVAVGTCLSGGVDSSAIASAMAHIVDKPSEMGGRSGMGRNAPDWRHAFIACFPGTVLDERIYADAVVAHTGAIPHHWTFDADAALGNIVDSVWATEDIYPGLTVPIWSIYREMRRQGVTVSLDGHGGDELLGGYTWYLDWPMNRVNDGLYHDFHTGLLPSILRNFDRCSMAHGIEVRMPLMDWRLVRMACSLGPEAKIGGGYTKRILRDSMAGIMPEAIRQRRSKLGFNSPMIEWLNGGMANLVREVVSHPFWRESPFWDGPRLGDAILRKTAARAWSVDDWATALSVWTMMNLVIWQILFVERAGQGRNGARP